MGASMIRGVLTLALSIPFVAPFAVADVGSRALSVANAERSAPLGVTLWYPAGSGGEPVRVGENGVFRGTAVQRDAAIEDGPLPLVMLLHGGFRSAPDSAAWLAAALAEAGFLVATVAPPPLPPGPAPPAAPAEVWRRPADLSAALSAVLADPVGGAAAARGEVAAVGFFLGGDAVLAAAGARRDPAAFQGICEGDAAAGIDCRWLAAGGVDPRTVDWNALERDARDARIAAVVAVEPEFADSFARASLPAVGVPVTLLDLGDQDPALARLAEDLATARRISLPQVSPFATFGLCKPKGTAILREEGGEPVCDDPPGSSREQIHAEIADVIVTVLRQAFPH